MNLDILNSAFEGFGGIAVALNCRRLYKDKKVMGTTLAPTYVFAAWGIFNLWYYPMLHQWASTVAGVTVVIANLTWLAMALYYRDRPCKESMMMME